MNRLAFILILTRQQWMTALWALLPRFVTASPLLLVRAIEYSYLVILLSGRTKAIANLLHNEITLNSYSADA